MEKFYPTKAGIEYAALTAQGKIIEFTKGKFGDGVRSTENITELTDLIHPLGELPISKKSVKNSTIITTTQFSNRVGGSILPTFYLMEIGLFAKVVNADGTDDDEHPETLIGYAFDGHGDKIIGTSLSEFIINIPLTVADVNNVTVDIDSLVYPTLKQFEDEVNTRKTEDEELQNSLNVHITDTSNPHGVTAEQIGLDKVPNVATNDQTPTYSQNSTLSNIVSGEKISVSFGKIMKAIADLISHIGSKSNPHSVTKSQVGLDNVPNVATNDQQPTFAESGTRSNIVSGETLSTLFGKIKKFFADLKTVAFTGSYTDLSNKPTSMQNPNSLTLTMNGSATSYNGSATASKSWYAPTSAGTTGYNLISNGSGAPIWQQPPYAVCPDSPSISDRRLSITNFKLLTGVRVLVRFTYPFAGTQGKVTLNVNSTGAKEVKLLRADGSYDAITQYNSWSTNEIVEFVYDGTYWVALSSDKQFVSGKPSVITVGSSTVTRYCDFKCSGTDDDIVIQKAMDSLTDGGKIILLEGTYNLSSRLLQKKNVVIEGQGRGITKVNTSYIFLISNLVGTSPTLHLTNMDINFLSTSNISPNAGAFNDYDVLQIDNCSISYANTMHNTDSIFFNCKVKLKNSRISVTLPAKRYDNSHPCWWIFRDCTAEIIDTDIIFPTTSNNTLSNGVFYRCEGSMVGGFIKHIGTTVSSNHSYIEDDSTMNIIGTQIECRRFSQSETTTGNFNSLANCRIKILQAEGYFSASHINHCDLYISASVIFCAYCMASNCKLWFSAASLATLKNYCFFEACYTNQSTWIGTNGTGTSTTDTKTVSGMAAPSFRSVS
ncbi:hypothetical protein [Hominilimicola sp.]|uniref:hypothetical protein n=1 Tax=Hominilimicola sp. TaxID=3073571 RepID=UPI00399F3B49